MGSVKNNSGIPQLVYEYREALMRVNDAERKLEEAFPTRTAKNMLLICVIALEPGKSYAEIASLSGLDTYFVQGRCRLLSKGTHAQLELRYGGHRKQARVFLTGRGRELYKTMLLAL